MSQQREEAMNNTVQSMRSQETRYSCCDYLYQEQRCSDFSRMNLPQNGVNVGCRSSMMQWMQTVVSFIGFDTETVEISMSYLDRFLQTEAGKEAIRCRTIFQLAAMTALYTAVKINCAEALTPKLLADLSQGVYQEQEFEEMERLMLHALKWLVNPPTAVAFVRDTIGLLPSEVFESDDQKQAVTDSARVQVEWAVGDYEFVTIKKSVIAFAALSNSLRASRIQFDLKKFLKEQFNDKTLHLDLQHSTLVKKDLYDAMSDHFDADHFMNASFNNLEDEDNGSVKSLDNSSNDGPVKRISAGKSPRSVIYRNVAA